MHAGRDRVASVIFLRRELGVDAYFVLGLYDHLMSEYHFLSLSLGALIVL